MVEIQAPAYGRVPRASGCRTKGEGFPMFPDMASVGVAQALRKESRVLLPAAEREHLRESGFPPQIAIPPRDLGGLVGSPLTANSIGSKKFRLCRMSQIRIA